MVIIFPAHSPPERCEESCCTYTGTAKSRDAQKKLDHNSPVLSPARPSAASLLSFMPRLADQLPRTLTQAIEASFSSQPQHIHHGTSPPFLISQPTLLSPQILTIQKPQLPLGLLTAAQGHPMLVELKNGETLNGHLIACDTWMNLTLKEVVQTSPEGDRFTKLAEVYVRGNNVSLFFLLSLFLPSFSPQTSCATPRTSPPLLLPCSSAPSRLSLSLTQRITDQISPRARRDHRSRARRAAEPAAPAG